MEPPVRCASCAFPPSRGGGQASATIYPLERPAVDRWAQVMIAPYPLEVGERPAWRNQLLKLCIVHLPISLMPHRSYDQIILATARLGDLHAVLSRKVIGGREWIGNIDFVAEPS